MNFQNNNKFQIGFILIMLSVGVHLAEDTFDLGNIFIIISGLMALSGFVLMLMGVYDSKNS